MVRVTCFRADKRQFAVGQVIKTAGHFTDMHPGPGKLAEVLLGRAKPVNLPDRSECLMLFPDEHRARDFCSRMSGGLLYKVEVDEEDVVHRGDMHIVDTIALNFHRGINDNDELAKSYWRGDILTDPCVEVLVLEGVVLEQLDFSQVDREDLIRARYGIKKFVPEPYPWENS